MKLAYTNPLAGITSREFHDAKSQEIIYYLTQTVSITEEDPDQKILSEEIEKIIQSVKAQGFKIPENSIVEVFEGVDITSFNEIIQTIRIPVILDNDMPLLPEINFFDKHHRN